MVERVDKPAVLVDEMQNATDSNLLQGIEKGVVDGLSAARILEGPTAVRATFFDLEVLILPRGDPSVDLSDARFEQLAKLGQMCLDGLFEDDQASFIDQLILLLLALIVE